jgi:hypothetical protein
VRLRGKFHRFAKKVMSLLGFVNQLSGKVVVYGELSGSSNLLMLFVHGWAVEEASAHSGRILVKGLFGCESLGKSVVIGISGLLESRSVEDGGLGRVIVNIKRIIRTEEVGALRGALSRVEKRIKYRLLLFIALYALVRVEILI